MTISDFNDKSRYADKCITELDAAQPQLSEIMQLITEAVKDKKDVPVELIRERVNHAIIAINKARSQVQDYHSLLNQIARTTDIEWPPTCRHKE